MKSKSFNFFKVITQGQTYMNMLYLLLSFPLGIFYFVFLVTGISLGLGLAITLLGIPILLSILLLGRVFAGFERQLTEIMLGIDITNIPIKQPKGIWKKIQSYLKDSFTWKSLAYLFIKFPSGIISFVILVVFITVPFAFIATPFFFHLWNIGLINGEFMTGPFIFMRTYWFTIILGIMGVFMLFLAMHTFNGFAWVFGLLTKSLLERKK